MTAIAPKVWTSAEIKRSRNLGITYILLALFVMWFFGVGSMGEGSSTFRLTRPSVSAGCQAVSISSTVCITSGPATARACSYAVGGIEVPISGVISSDNVIDIVVCCCTRLQPAGILLLSGQLCLYACARQNKVLVIRPVCAPMFRKAAPNHPKRGE